MNEWVARAAAVLKGEPLDAGVARALADVPGEEVLDLVALANRVRNRFSPPFQACSIINAKSGLCSENCRFCAQSASHATPAQIYPMVSAETILAAAETAYSEGVRSFCIVTGGYGMTEPEGDFAPDRLGASLSFRRGVARNAVGEFRHSGRP